MAATTARMHRSTDSPDFVTDNDDDDNEDADAAADEDEDDVDKDEAEAIASVPSTIARTNCTCERSAESRRADTGSNAAEADHWRRANCIDCDKKLEKRDRRYSAKIRWRE